MSAPDAPASVVLLVATEWMPSKGGVSSFNQELGAALARIGAAVHCVVHAARPSEIEHAHTLGVTLHSAADRGVAPATPFELGIEPTIVVGHDRVTGPAAARWRERHPAARVAHFLHVHPRQIDGLKTDASVRAREDRVHATQTQAAAADLVVGVGEPLAARWRTDLPGLDVVTFTPALPQLLPARSGGRSPHPQVLFLGRAEDAELKGLPLMVDAMWQVARRNPAVELVVRGATEGGVVELEREIRATYRKPCRLDCRTFSADRDVVAHDIASAWLVVQPSLEDGFGLVTLEALALRTPVLVSARSGVADALSAVDCEARAGVLDVVDPQAWATAIERDVVREPEQARMRATRLAEAFHRKHTWDAAALDLLERAQSVKFPRSRGRVDYAASEAASVRNSYSAGLR